MNLRHGDVNLNIFKYPKMLTTVQANNFYNFIS